MAEKNRSFCQSLAILFIDMLDVYSPASVGGGESFTKINPAFPWNILDLFDWFHIQSFL